MSDDVVTRRDVAGLICEMLNDALVAESSDRAPYSSSVQLLFQQAWDVAAHRKSVQVTIYHLAYALVFNNPEAGEKLAEVLGSDVDSLAVGCILRILPLGVSTGDSDIVPPAVGTVRWLKQAVALALKRGQRSELLPEDLVRAVLDGALPASEYNALRRAARVGNARGDAVVARPVPSIADVPPSSRDIIKHMEEVEKGYSPNPESNVIDLRSLLQELEERMMRKLGTIDQRIVAIGDALPRAPSGARVATAVVAVLILGLASGLASRFSPLGGSLLSQVFSIMK